MNLKKRRRRQDMPPEQQSLPWVNVEPVEWPTSSPVRTDRRSPLRDALLLVAGAASLLVVQILGWVAGRLWVWLLG
jgi:hypothetical protein